MTIIKQYDKRSGITYAYESHSYWDPEKKMTRAKRKLIGRVDPETGRSFQQMGETKNQKHRLRVIQTTKKCMKSF